MSASCGMRHRIGGVLEKCAARVRPAGGTVWAFELVNGRRLLGTACWEEPWLRLATELTPPPCPDRSWQLLERNAQLPASARAVHSESGRLELQAELLLSSPMAVEPRLTRACAALHEGAAVLEGWPAAAVQTSPRSPESDGGEPDWVRHAGEAGWKLEHREGGRFGVELDAPGLPSQAWMVETGGELRIWIEQLRGASLVPEVREAVARFALALTGTLRLVRGALLGEEPTLCFEMRLAPDAGARDLDLALAALSLACRGGTRELRALADRQVAERFLNHLNEGGTPCGSTKVRV